MFPFLIYLWLSFSLSFKQWISNTLPARSCKCSRSLVVPFGQGAVYVVTIPHRGSLFYLWINYMARLPSDAISRPGNARFAFTFAFAFAFACAFRSASRTPSAVPMYVATNELGDPRFEPGNWNVRIKLAAHPSVAARLYRSSSYPCPPFSLSCRLLPPLSLSPVTAISASGPSVSHRSLNRSFN